VSINPNPEIASIQPLPPDEVVIDIPVGMMVLLGLTGNRCATVRSPNHCQIQHGPNIPGGYRVLSGHPLIEIGLTDSLQDLVSSSNR
jgi:hypothetical protein